MTKKRFERPLPSEMQHTAKETAVKQDTVMEEAQRKQERKLAAFDWLLKQENGRIVWAAIFERCGYSKPILLRMATGDIAPLSTEAAAAQREVYRDLRKMVSPEILAAAEFEAEFGAVKIDKTAEGEK